MKKEMIRYAKLFLTAAAAAGLLSGCMGQAASGGGESDAVQAAGTQTAEGNSRPETAEGNGELIGEIEMVTNAEETTYNAVNEILQKFMKENPRVKISYSTQGSDYEQLMKARMASNDLPDIFATHGWSVGRYSEYLRPLNDQSWYETIDQSFLPNIQNDSGQVFVLPLNMDQGGLMYNKALVKELGIGIPATWEEFMADCDLAKSKGDTAVFLAGKDSRQPANLLDIAATTYLASCEDKGYTDQLSDGSFDWKNWKPVSQLLMDLKTKSYLNVDCVTCDPVDIPARLAKNNILFMLTSSPDLIAQAAEINPEAQYGMAPVPALNSSYKPAFCGGEREAYGVWKDTKHEDICLAVLNYMAKPENVKLICEASGKRSAIQNVNPDLGTVAEDYAKYADAAIYPFFDRIYLPNGMWSTMKTIGSALIGNEMTVDESVKAMQSDYETLRAQN